MKPKIYQCKYFANTATVLIFMAIAINLCSCNLNKLQGVKTYATSTFANKNVYKSKDTITLYKVYDINNGLAYHNVDTTYKLIFNLNSTNKTPHTTNGYAYVRYRIVKDGSVSYLKFLPATYFKQSVKNNIPDTKGNIIVYVSPDIDNTEDFHNIKVGDTVRADRFYFKFTDTARLSPAQKYLATEQLTGVPITIPFKYRLNDVPGRDRITTSFTLGYAFGFRYRLGNNPYSDNFIRTVFAIGAGTATYFNSTTTNPNTTITTQTTTTTTSPKQILPDGSEKVTQIQEISKTGSDINTAQFMYSTAWGITFELGSRLNLGVFYGWDHMVGSHRDWVYQSKPWFGAGIGLNIGAAKAAVGK